jgi:hypothetical protein
MPISPPVEQNDGTQRSAAKMMSEMPPEFRDQYGRKCELVRLVCKRCDSVAKGKRRAFTDCWRCVATFPTLCNPPAKYEDRPRGEYCDACTIADPDVRPVDKVTPDRRAKSRARYAESESSASSMSSASLTVAGPRSDYENQSPEVQKMLKEKPWRVVQLRPGESIVVQPKKSESKK